MKCHILDSLPEVGGRCAELYPDRPIYDIPGIPVCSGEELVQALMNQTARFDATFHLNDEVTELTQQSDGKKLILSGSHKAALAAFAAKAIVEPVKRFICSTRPQARSCTSGWAFNLMPSVKPP